MTSKAKFVRRQMVPGESGDGAVSAPIANLFGVSDRPMEIEIDLDRIEVGLHQPRLSIDDEGIEELARSIERDGLLYPILVKKGDGGRYQLVGGERRLRACRRLRWTTIFARIVKGDPDEIALIDNLQRRQLNALEIARALERLRQAHGYTQEQVGDVAGMNRVAVTRLLAVLSLAPAILEEYPNHADRVSRSALEEIAAAPTKAQVELWQAAKNGATVKVLQERKREARPAGGAGETARVVSSFRGIAKHLDRLIRTPVDEVRAAMTERDREKLQRLRDHLDRLLANDG